MTNLFKPDFFPYDVQRPLLDFLVDSSDVLAENSDGDELPFALQRREKPGSGVIAPDYSAPYMVEEGTGSDKGSLKNATTFNPAGPPSRSAEPETVGPAYPGQ